MQAQQKKMSSQEQLSSLRFLAQSLYANPERARDLLDASITETPAWDAAVELKKQLQPVLEARERADREKLRQQIRQIAEKLFRERNSSGSRRDAADALYWAALG